MFTTNSILYSTLNVTTNKQKAMKRTAISMLRMLAICGSLLAFSTACDDDDDDNPPIVDDDMEFNNIQLSGANERPEPVDSDGSGTFDGTYDDGTNTLDYTVTWTLGNPQDTVTAMHFHAPADTSESAGPVLPITGFATDSVGTFSDTAVLTDDQEDDLRAGLWYINVHSVSFPNGELRGQLLED